MLQNALCVICGLMTNCGEFVKKPSSSAVLSKEKKLIKERTSEHQQTIKRQRLLLTGKLWNLFSISHTFTIENLKENLPENIAKGTKDPRIEFISQNLDYASTSKSQPNISISTKSKVKILTKPSFRILTKIQLPNQQETVSNTILITDISNSNNLNKYWVGIFTRQGHIYQVY